MTDYSQGLANDYHDQANELKAADLTRAEMSAELPDGPGSRAMSGIPPTGLYGTGMHDFVLTEAELGTRASMCLDDAQAEPLGFVDDWHYAEDVRAEREAANQETAEQESASTGMAEIDRATREANFDPWADIEREAKAEHQLASDETELGRRAAPGLRQETISPDHLETVTHVSEYMGLGAPEPEMEL
jgi:hypothetical protein